jgi:hypothetical protein
MPCLAAARPAASRRTFRHASLPPASAVFSAPRSSLLCGLKRRARVRAWVCKIWARVALGARRRANARTVKSSAGHLNVCWASRGWHGVGFAAARSWARCCGHLPGQRWPGGSRRLRADRRLGAPSPAPGRGRQREPGGKGRARAERRVEMGAGRAGRCRWCTWTSWTCES